MEETKYYLGSDGFKTYPNVCNVDVLWTIEWITTEIWIKLYSHLIDVHIFGGL